MFLPWLSFHQKEKLSQEHPHYIHHPSIPLSISPAGTGSYETLSCEGA